LKRWEVNRTPEAVGELGAEQKEVENEGHEDRVVHSSHIEPRRAQQQHNDVVNSKGANDRANKAQAEARGVELKGRREKRFWRQRKFQRENLGVRKASPSPQVPTEPITSKLNKINHCN